MGQALMLGRCFGATVTKQSVALAGQSLRTTVIKNLRTDRIVRALVRCGATPSPTKGVLCVCRIAAVIAKDGAAHVDGCRRIAPVMHVCNWVAASKCDFVRGW